MKRSVQLSVLFSVLLIATAAGAGAGEQIPQRPEELRYPPLSFDVPDAEAMRFELSNGTTVYALEDRLLPLVNVAILFRGGQYLEPEGKEGIAAITAEAWRNGGAGERTAQQLDEELDFLAANLSTSINEVMGVVTLSVLSKDLPVAMSLLMDLITAPRFQEDRFDKAREDLIQDMKTRNDSSARIEHRVWSRLIYGDDFWLNRLPTKASLEAITVADCKQLVASLMRGDNLVVAVSGDFKRADMQQLLERTIATLPRLEQPLPKPPQPEHTPEPGVYVVNKTEVNQGRVTIGHIGGLLGDPDEFPLRLMNEIMGGGSFTSRTMKRVRSDEGLTYSAHTSYGLNSSYPGTFRASFQSKFSTCPFGIEIIVGIMKDMRTSDVSEVELTTARNIFVEQFPRSFETARETVMVFATDEILDRPEGYWISYRDKVKAVTIAEVREAAASHVHPDKLVVLVVGNLEELLKGHPDHEAKLSDFGEVRTIPLRDPLTLEPLQE